MRINLHAKTNEVSRSYPSDGAYQNAKCKLITKSVVAARKDGASSIPSFPTLPRERVCNNELRRFPERMSHTAPPGWMRRTFAHAPAFQGILWANAGTASVRCRISKKCLSLTCGFFADSSTETEIRCILTVGKLRVRTEAVP